MLLENWAIFTSSLFLSAYFLLLGSFLNCLKWLCPLVYIFRMTHTSHVGSITAVLQNSCKDEFGRMNVFNINVVNRP